MRLVIFGTAGAREMIQVITLFFNGAANSAAMRVYRNAVEPLLLRHGALQISRALVRNPRPGDADEIHTVNFPELSHLGTLQQDPDYMALAEQRETAMHGAVTYVAEDYITYLD